MNPENMDRRLDGWAEEAVGGRDVDASGFLAATRRRRSQVIRRRITTATGVIGGLAMIALVVGVALRAPQRPERGLEIADASASRTGLPTLAALKAMNDEPGSVEDPVLPASRGVSWVASVSALP